MFNFFNLLPTGLVNADWVVFYFYQIILLIGFKFYFELYHREHQSKHSKECLEYAGLLLKYGRYILLLPPLMGYLLFVPFLKG